MSNRHLYDYDLVIEAKQDLFNCCPQCGTTYYDVEFHYVAEYDEWWCYSCHYEYEVDREGFDE
jgi:transposase-like protein